MYETDPDPHSQNAPYHNAEETPYYGTEHSNDYPHLQEQGTQSYSAMPQITSEQPSKSNGHGTSMTIPATMVAQEYTSFEAIEEQSATSKSAKKGPRTWSATSGSGPPRRRSSQTLPPTFPVEADSLQGSHGDPSQSVSPSSALPVMSLSNLLLPNETPMEKKSFAQFKSIATDDDTEEEREGLASEVTTNSTKKKASKAKKPMKARVSKSIGKEDVMGAPPSKRRKRADDLPSELTVAIPTGYATDVFENASESANLDNLLYDTGAFDGKSAALASNGKGTTKGKGTSVKRPRKKNPDASAVKKRGTPSGAAGSKRTSGPSSARGKKSAERVRTIYDSHSSNSDGDSDHSTPGSRSQIRRNGSGVRKNSKLNNETTYSPSDSGDDAAGEELNAHVDVLNYIQHVRQRNQRVLDEYEAQCQLKRDRLHKKFLARYERQVAAAKARQEEARRQAEEERKRLEELEAQRLAEEQAAVEEAAAAAAAEAAELAKEKKRRRKRRRSKVEPGQDEETTLRRQEAEARRAYGLAVEERTRKIWSSICRKHIPKVAKLVAQSTASRLTNCRRIAQVCQREQRKVNSKTTKATRDMPIRARRVTREMLIFWKKNEKEERELRKKAEKEALERARVEEEMREARRQARKLNFLITQTELYSHFVGKKIGTEEAMKPGPGDTFAAPEPMQSTPNIHELHDDLDITGDGDAPEMFDEIDFDDDDEVKLRQRARQAAQNALMLQQERTRTFDAGARERRAEAAAATANANTSTNQSTSSFDIDDMNFQEPSMPSNHAEVHQPKMLTCTLKGYQLKGLNWLANLYEQGINGILADEMGLGKTVQSISLMAYLAETHDIWGPFLVIAPASTLHNWQQEISRFTPHLRALPYWGNVKDRKILRRFWSKKQLYSKDAPFHVLITSYQLVVSDEKYFQRVKWQYMVLDEAQAIKSSTSARWKTLLGFNCRNRLLLTGTPIQNTMQELWALLHFIMPSLFDSHEEFSEWFSKDIEAASENKGTLNEHQLRRLHMILKPFMLRRVKKHVQNELGDKIELEVYCDLTARQRALYRGLKEKISVSELLERASADDGVDSLMNLVMQFRKVCNHPELFERADVLTPFAMCKWAGTSSMAREGDFLRVPYSSRGTLKVVVPKMMYRTGGILEVPNEDTDYLERLKCVGERFGVWTPEYIRRSMFGEENGDVNGVRQAKGAFSFLRFVDSSPQETSAAFFGPLIRNVANLIQSRRKIGRRQFYNWVNPDDRSNARVSPGLALFEISQTSPRTNPLGVAIVSNALRVMSSVVEDMAAHHPLRKMLPAYMPKVIAPPPDVVCSDRGFTVKHEDYLFDCEARAALNGISTLLPEHTRSPLSGNPTALLLEETHGTPLLTETFIDQGYSHVWVPALSKLVLDSGKLARLDSLLTELKAGGHRVLIYFQMTRMIDLMEEYLTYRQYTYLRLDGSSKISERRDMVGDWQTRPDLFVFLLSTRAGGLGINLTAADTVVFYDSDWNPTVDQQAMDRAHRLGQTKQVTVYRLITKGTIEERILQRAKQKDEIQKVVMTGTGTAEGFKQQVDFNKPREIVSLLLDDEELEDKLRRQAEKRKIEEEAKANNKKKKATSGGAGTPTNAGKSKRSAPAPVRTLEDMWHEDEPAFQMDEEAGAAETGSQRRAGGPPKKKSRKNSASTESKEAAPKKSRPNSARSSSGKFAKKSTGSGPASASTAGSVAPSSTFASPAPNNT